MKIYIGDSVYAEVDRGMIKLTTENGMGISNEIYLEDSVWNNLKLFAKNKFEITKGEQGDDETEEKN